MKLTCSLGVVPLAGLVLAASATPSTRVGAESLVEQVVDMRLVPRSYRKSSLGRGKSPALRPGQPRTRT